MPKQNALEPSDLQGILKYASIYSGQKFLIGIDYKRIQKGNFAMIFKEINLLISLNIHLILYFYNDEISASSIVDIDDELLCQLRSGPFKMNSFIIERHVRKKACVDKLISKISKSIYESSVILLRPKRTSIAFYESAICDYLLKHHTPNKCIFLGRYGCPIVNDEAIKNISSEELRNIISTYKAMNFPKWFLPYASLAIKIINYGVERVHIINSNRHNPILNELFDKIGIGLMIHANRYEVLREAVESDVNSLYHLTMNSVKKDTLLSRTIDHIKSSITQYRVYEIDGSIVACICLDYFKKDNAVEIGSVYVQPYYNGRGIGRRLVNHACKEALKDGYEMAFILTVHATKFFMEKCGFSSAKFKDLPSQRQISYRKNQRKSHILRKTLC